MHSHQVVDGGTPLRQQAESCLMLDAVMRPLTHHLPAKDTTEDATCLWYYLLEGKNRTRHSRQVILRKLRDRKPVTQNPAMRYINNTDNQRKAKNDVVFVMKFLLKTSKSTSKHSGRSGTGNVCQGLALTWTGCPGRITCRSEGCLRELNLR